MTNNKEMLKTKENILTIIDEIVNKIGKRKAGELLSYQFNNIDFYQEDKRTSKIKFVKECIENCYKDSPNDYELETNQEIEEAIFNVLNY